MPTIDQIYRDNLKVLISEAGGTLKAFAEKMGKDAPQVSQWLNASPDSKTGKPRAMSRRMAREIEAKCGKPEGWMDRPHAASGEPAAGWPFPDIDPKRFADLEPGERTRIEDTVRGMIVAFESRRASPSGKSAGSSGGAGPRKAA